MFGAPLVRATVMQQQRRPNISNVPSSSAIRTTVMANLASQSQRENKSNGPVVNNQTQASAAKPASNYVDIDPQMFIDSPFVGGATLTPAASYEPSHARGKSQNGSFDLKFFNPSSDPRLFAM